MKQSKARGFFSNLHVLRSELERKATQDNLHQTAQNLIEGAPDIQEIASRAAQTPLSAETQLRAVTRIIKEEHEAVASHESKN